MDDENKMVLNLNAKQLIEIIKASAAAAIAQMPTSDRSLQDVTDTAGAIARNATFAILGHTQE